MRLAAIAVLSIGLATLLGTVSRADDWADDGGNCVSYVRDVTGVDLQGNAGAWWALAEGRYARGHQPEKGAILVFQASRSMPSGHVAVVSQVISKREIQVDQANWIRGRVVKNLWVVDASPDNDWTVVEVENLGSQTYGRDNPAYGFVYPKPPRPRLDEIAVARASPLRLRAAFEPVRFAVAAPDRTEARPTIQSAVYVIEDEPLKKTLSPGAADYGAGMRTKESGQRRGTANAKHEAVRHEVVKHEPAKHETAKHETAKHEAARHDPARHDPAKHEVAERHDAKRLAKKPAGPVKAILAAHKVTESLD